MNKDFIVPFGIDQHGEWTTVYSVPNGLACNCVCPACGDELVAKKGPCVAWHFAHHSNTSSTSCGETSIHKCAKYILLTSKGKVLHLPRNKQHHIGTSRGEYRCVLGNGRAEHRIAEARRQVDVFVETWIKRDAWPERNISSVWRKGNPLVVEICVTHPKDNHYMKDIQRSGVSALEISISKEEVLSEMQKAQGDRMSAMRRLVLGPRSGNRKWIWLKEIAGPFIW